MLQSEFTVPIEGMKPTSSASYKVRLRSEVGLLGKGNWDKLRVAALPVTERYEAVLLPVCK